MGKPTLRMYHLRDVPPTRKTLSPSDQQTKPETFASHAWVEEAGEPPLHCQQLFADLSEPAGAQFFNSVNRTPTSSRTLARARLCAAMVQCRPEFCGSCHASLLVKPQNAIHAGPVFALVCREALCN